MRKFQIPKKIFNFLIFLKFFKIIQNFKKFFLIFKKKFTNF